MFAIPGVVIGVKIADSISMDHFKLMFAIVTLVVTGITLLRGRLKKNPNIIESTEAVKKLLKGVKSHKLIIVYVACFFAGIVSSLFGIGGGVIFMPLLLAMFAITMRFSSPVSLLAVAILAGS